MKQMLALRSTSILVRLLMIVVAALAPSLAFHAYAEIEARHVRQQLMEEEALRLLNLIVAQQQAVVDAAEQVLDVMAGAPSVQDNVPGECERLLVNLLKASSRYSNASVLDRDGHVVCAAVPVAHGVTVTDRAYFRRALETGRFAVGGYVVGRGSGQPTIQLGKPFLDQDGKVIGIVQVSLNLRWLAEAIDALPLPAGSIAAIADSDGVFLARRPGGMRDVGQTIQEQYRYLLEGDRARVYPSLISRDNGRRVIVAVSPPGATPSGLQATVALDEETSFAAVTQANRTGFLLIAAGAALGLVMTAALGGGLIRRPVARLLDVAERWRRGDLGARTGLDRDGGEFGRLAVAFEDMAATLHTRERTLRRLSGNLEARVQEEVTAREAAQQRAAQAERMQALGQLAGGIAHDINNVLQAAGGALRLIDRRSGDPAAVHRFAELGSQAIERGASVTRRLLTLGRHGDQRGGPVDLGDLLSGLREILTYTLGRGIHIQVAIPTGVPTIVADKGQLETVLINLATNARDAMPNGGTLRFEAAAEVVGGTGPRHPAALAPGNYVRLTVSDTGVGMDEATVARAREPFFTTKEAGAGTGLGLPIAFGFAEQSDGGLTIDSQPGVGTRVTLWLPQAVANPPPFVAEPSHSKTVEAAARILLVDDEDMVREVLARHLEDAGYRVMTAANGVDAVAWLAGGMRVDALVTDLSMPGMDGLALIRAVRESHPELPVVVLTGFAQDAVALAAGAGVGGAISLLRKPVTEVQLLDHISAILAGADLTGR
jgi:signal transduction histidine kinase/ActR/RegA family two-component response regulator